MGRPSARAALLDTAERLFAEHGLQGISLRSINAEAGLSSAALHYHFGSKGALVEALLERNMPALMRRRGELLGALDALPRPPTTREVLSALLEPQVELLEQGVVLLFVDQQVLEQMALHEEALAALLLQLLGHADDFLLGLVVGLDLFPDLGQILGGEAHRRGRERAPVGGAPGAAPVSRGAPPGRARRAGGQALERQTPGTGQW